MSGYNMNYIDPFGFGQREQSPSSNLTNTAPTQDPNSLSGGQGVMGDLPIRQYLMPLLGQISNQMEEEKRNKIEPYLQEVQQLTDRTFPDLSLSGGGLRGGIGSLFGGGMNQFQGGIGIGSLFGGGMNQFQGGLDPISQNQVSNTIESSPNQNPSPFGTSSFF